ncbi:hypothetical protein SAY87_025124 [Trapa incisa]|uniref:DUF4228 domain protein n=2 Tax=Trapa TaxID=22665 RepID=A0AAN7LLV4_TRANT|nr:hypothetical protein SAY87_025124 [Trapa incisa]KAK4788712.1 hypothetical protein SAY86_020031 [Trapa natans]
MGNSVSCTLMAAPSIMKKNRKYRPTTVVFPDGEVRQLTGQLTITAAEFMIECPNYFLANTRSLHVGRRFSALSADEELESGNLYILFPMKRVKSIVTAVDMAPLRLMGTNTGSRRVSKGSGYDLKDAKSEEPGPTLGVEAEQISELPTYRCRLSSCGSRKPLLETIREESVWSR